MKLLTISIAAYNVEKYLEKALTSMVCSPTAMEKLEVIEPDVAQRTAYDDAYARWKSNLERAMAAF
jgi:hypothetical protein